MAVDEVEVRVEKRFGRAFCLDVDFSFGRGCLAVLGASGSGKSLLLKCLAGVAAPDRGRIVVGDRVLFDSGARVDVSPQERRVGILFQQYALFPNMTVERNIGIGAPGSAAARAGVVSEYLRRYRLEGLGGRYPGQLSGGQQQRVALARMLAAGPEVILLDEPFSALDSHLRERVRLDMLGVVRENPYVVMVTHSIDDAYRMSDRMLVLDDGAIVGFGGTRELFRDPGHVRVAEITGCGNVSRVEWLGDGRVRAVDWGVDLEAGRGVGAGGGYVGIREGDLRPAVFGDVNVVCPRVVEVGEDLLGVSVVFENAGGGGGRLVWRCERGEFEGVPGKLAFPPESLFFMKG